MKALLFLSLAFLAFVLGSCRPSTQGPLRTVGFIVTADTVVAHSTIHISGNHPALGDWNPDAVRLSPDSAGSWSRSFEFPEGTALEYKLTLGSWDSEAVDESGLELPNAFLEVRSDTTVYLHVKSWRSLSGTPEVVSPVRFRNKAGVIELFRHWKFHQGDDSLWASPDFDDASWETADTRLPAEQWQSRQWNTVGWFRLPLTIDSALFGTALGCQINQMGASEVYLDGQLVFAIGDVSDDPARVREQRDIVPKVITLGRQPRQVLAVRFASAHLQDFLRADQSGGFFVLLHDDPNAAVALNQSNTRSRTIQQWAFSTFPVVLAFTHLLLFAFYPSNRANLFYALSMLGWAGIIYTSFQGYFISDPLDALILPKLSLVSISAALAFGALTGYASSCEKIPLMAYALAGAAGTLAALAVLGHFPWIQYGYYALIGLTAIEMVRILFTGGIRSNDPKWIIGAGSVILMVSVILQILIGLGVFESVFGTRIIYIFGVFALSIAVSIDLSRGVARSNRDLKRQIDQIRELSERTLEQERRAKEIEVKRLVLEADNRRKTQELEEARALQLSMLPRQLPELSDLEIAAFMQPATEVGGDYYDFHVRADGALTLVVGDATGHGAKAGTMVTVTKSLFHQLAQESNVLTMLTRYNAAIRSLNLGNLYMAMAVARISAGVLDIAGAGMPPLLIFRSESGTVERIPLKGMPLGSTLDYPYRVQSVPLYGNDLVLFMSDGFPELLNTEGEQLEYERAEALFAKVARGTSKSVVDAFAGEAKRWANGRPYNDDLTFVALKVQSG